MNVAHQTKEHRNEWIGVSVQGPNNWVKVLWYLGFSCTMTVKGVVKFQGL